MKGLQTQKREDFYSLRLCIQKSAEAFIAYMYLPTNPQYCLIALFFPFSLSDLAKSDGTSSSGFIMLFKKRRKPGLFYGPKRRKMASDDAS